MRAFLVLALLAASCSPESSGAVVTPPSPTEPASESPKSPAFVGLGVVVPSHGATNQDAELLAQLLEQLGYLREDERKLVLLSRHDDQFKAAFFFRDRWDDPETIRMFEMIGRTIASTSRLRPLVIELCDLNTNPMKVLRFE